MIAYFTICPFLCVLTRFILLLVQLVVSSNFNRLQRKYECLCVLQGMMVLCTVCVEN